MTVSSTTFYTDWSAADGVNKNWSYDFQIDSINDVQILVRTGEDNSTVEVITSNISLIPIGEGAEGYVIYPASGAPLESDKQVRIRRIVGITQTTEIGNEGDFRPRIHEEAFDKLTQISQQLQGAVDRSIKTQEDGSGFYIEDVLSENSIVVFKDGKLRSGPPISDIGSSLPIGTTEGTVAAGNDSRFVFVQSGTGGVTRDLQGKLREVSSPQDFGAALGGADDTTPFLNWTARGGVGVIPAGDYLMPGGVGSPSDPRVIISEKATYNGNRFPFLSISKLATKLLPATYCYIRQDTADRADSTTMVIHRQSTTDDGHVNPKALRVVTVKDHSNAQTEWAISGELDSYSNTTSTGDTATSGVSNKYGLASVFGGHFQAKDWNIYATPEAVTGIVGTEINIPAIGLDHPTGNTGFGYRRVLDIIAATNTGKAGWDGPTGNFGPAEIGTGVIIRTQGGADGGYFRNALIIAETAGNPRKIGTAIRLVTSGDYGLRSTGAHAVASISIEGNSAVGLALTGAFTSAAIRLAGGQAIAMEATSSIKMKYDATIWGFFSGATERVGFQMSGTGTGVRVNGTKVLGAQGAAVVDATDAATAITQLNALLARSRAHGLIAT